MPQQQRSEETRARILHAALECFSRTGYDASGVAEICAAAGVSKGAFYHHFPTKQAVFIELLNFWAKRGVRLMASEPSRREKGTLAIRVVWTTYPAFSKAERAVDKNIPASWILSSFIGQPTFIK